MLYPESSSLASVSVPSRAVLLSDIRLLAIDWSCVTLLSVTTVPLKASQSTAVISAIELVHNFPSIELSLTVSPLRRRILVVRN